MSKRVLITQGDYAGRYLTMEDDQASEAISGGFALDGETDVSQEQLDEANANPVEDAVQKSRDFFAKLNEPPAASADEEDRSPKQSQAKTATRSRRSAGGE